MLLLFHRRVFAAGARVLLKGAAIGAVFFAVISCETATLRLTATSVTSFLENTSVALVPLLLALWRRKWPERRDAFERGAEPRRRGAADARLRPRGLRPRRGPGPSHRAALRLRHHHDRPHEPRRRRRAGHGHRAGLHDSRAGLGRRACFRAARRDTGQRARLGYHPRAGRGLHRLRLHAPARGPARHERRGARACSAR